MALATADVRDLRALAGLPGLGPRTLAKHGEALLGLIAAHPPDHYLLPTKPGHARMLERTDAGQALARPDAGKRRRPVLEAIVERLRALCNRA
jgi:hypothetical protein